MNSDSGNPYCPELRNRPYIYMANDGSKFPIFTIPKGKKRSCDSHLRFNTKKKKQYHTYYNYLQYNNITITTNYEWDTIYNNLYNGINDIQ